MSGSKTQLRRGAREEELEGRDFASENKIVGVKSI
jgi:hypothetical protein